MAETQPSIEERISASMAPAAAEPPPLAAVEPPPEEIVSEAPEALEQVEPEQFEPEALATDDTPDETPDVTPDVTPQDIPYDSTNLPVQSVPNLQRGARMSETLHISTPKCPSKAQSPQGAEPICPDDVSIIGDEYHII